MAFPQPRLTCLTDFGTALRYVRIPPDGAFQLHNLGSANHVALPSICSHANFAQSAQRWSPRNFGGFLNIDAGRTAVHMSGSSDWMPHQGSSNSAPAEGHTSPGPLFSRPNRLKPQALPVVLAQLGHSWVQMGPLSQGDRRHSQAATPKTSTVTTMMPMVTPSIGGNAQRARGFPQAAPCWPEPTTRDLKSGHPGPGSGLCPLNHDFRNLCLKWQICHYIC